VVPPAREEDACRPLRGRDFRDRVLVPIIRRCTAADTARWVALRQLLFPDCAHEEQLLEIAEHLADDRRYADFLAHAGGSAIGLAEAELRTDYVNGTNTRPVAFLEGVFVLPQERRKGVARALVAAVAQWGRNKGCRELASDALADNYPSHAVHRALGFEETERVVFFRQPLA
jgi:aminoglycoside 6'-N-acetyltransferase I